MLVASTLRGEGFDASDNGGNVTFVIQERTTSENPDSEPDGVGVSGDGKAYTLEARTVPQAVVSEITPMVLEQRGRKGGTNLEIRQDGTTNALRGANGGRAGTGIGAIATEMMVRRLTPRECERLQGFPDDYTLIPWRKGTAPDGPRYKALGNSMAV